jgi:hypothetical protein
MVTVVPRSAPSGPGRRAVAAVTETWAPDSPWRALSLVYWRRMPFGWPSVLGAG